jgi:hypothetical protein
MASVEVRLLVSVEFGRWQAKITRLVLAGLIPVKIVWELTPTKVGGYKAYVTCFNRMFSVNKINRRGPLEGMYFCNVLRLIKRKKRFPNWKRIQ